MPFYLPRYGKVLVRHFATHVETLELENDLAVVDARVRVMVIRFENRCHRVYEPEGIHEILEFILFRDFALPT